MKKLFLFCLCLALTICLLTGCIAPSDDFSVYRGSDPGFFTAVIHSIPGAYEGDTIRFIKLDEDPYGRVLYAGLDHFVSIPNAQNKGLCLVILQNITTDTVSFVEDYNYMIKEIPNNYTLSSELVYNIFSDDEIAELQLQNHWNEKWNGSMVTKSISRSREDAFDADIRREAFSRVSPHYRAFADVLLTTDNQGNAIYFLREYNPASPDGNKYGRAFLMWLNADGTVGPMEEVVDLHNYRDQLIAFKTANDWKVGD